MAKLAIKKASTDVTVYVFIQASNVTTGAGLTGLTFETASLVASYVRPLAARAALTLATQTVDGAHSDGGFVEVDATNMPGIYRLDLSDAICATGVNSVVVMLKGAANMSPCILEIQLTSFDPNDAVRMGLTALPNAAADAAGGLPISDAGGLDLDSQIKTDIDAILEDTGTTLDDLVDGVEGTLATMDGKLDTIDNFLDTEVAAILADTDELQTDWVNGGRLDLLIDGLQTTINDGFDGETVSGVQTVVDAILVDTGTTIPATLETIDNFLDTEVAAILADTNELQTDLTDGGRLDLILDAILVDTSTTLDDLVDGLETMLTDIHDTDLPAIKAETALIVEDTGTTIPATIETIDNFLDTEVAAILADTNELQTDWVNGGRLDLLIDAIKTEVDTHPTAGEIWASTTRTLTYPISSVTNPSTDDPIEIYRDTTVVINFTGLGDVSAYSAAGDIAWFTIKENLGDADTASILQMKTTSFGDSGAASTLLYVNGAAPTADTEGSFLFSNYTTGAATATLKAVAAVDLPVFAVTPVYWDIKATSAASVVTILATGTAYIYATSTRTIA